MEQAYALGAMAPASPRAVVEEVTAELASQQAEQEQESRRYKPGAGLGLGHGASSWQPTCLTGWAVSSMWCGCRTAAKTRSRTRSRHVRTATGGCTCWTGARTSSI